MAAPYIAKYCIDTGAYVAPGTVGPTVSGGYECVIGPIRVLSVQNNASQIALFNSWWQEQLNMFGQQVNYYINGYNLSAHDFFYGEQPLVRFAPPIPMVMAITMSNDSVILSKFGLEGQADLTALIAINTFTSTVTAVSGSLSAANYEPKSGDLIELSEFGSTRPNKRSGKVFEITERLDEANSEEMNQLLGHYVWVLKAKRFDYNYELNAPRESQMDQVFDNMADGAQNNLPEIIETKVYSQTIDKDSVKVFDYTQNPKSNAGVYGDYENQDELVNVISSTGNTTSALGSSTDYIVTESPSNYDAGSTASIDLAAANAAALNTLGSLLSTYNPALSSLSSFVMKHRSLSAGSITLTTLTSLLSTGMPPLSTLGLQSLPPV